MKLDNLNTIFKRVLIQGSGLIVAIAVLGSVIGFLTVGATGVTSALIGAGMTLLFVTLTAMSVFLGGKLGIGAFFGIVMGGWILKLVLFMVLVKILLGNDSINGPVLFFTLIASIMGSLAVDSLAVLKARMPIVEN